MCVGRGQLQRASSRSHVPHFCETRSFTGIWGLRGSWLTRSFKVYPVPGRFSRGFWGLNLVVRLPRQALCRRSALVPGLIHPFSCSLFLVSGEPAGIAAPTPPRLAIHGPLLLYSQCHLRVKNKAMGDRRHSSLGKQKCLTLQEPGGCAYSGPATEAPASHSSLE